MESNAVSVRDGETVIGFHISAGGRGSVLGVFYFSFFLVVVGGGGGGGGGGGLEVGGQVEIALW